MLPYVPFGKDGFAMVMGVRTLGPGEPVFVVDDAYADEIALKQRLFSDDAALRVGSQDGASAIVWECLEGMLPILAREHPRDFDASVAGREVRFDNRRTGIVTTFELGDAASLPVPPLQWLGSQVQEDLCLLDGTIEGTPLVAGCLCFPSMWSLREKLGKPLLEIHDPVPSFHEKLGRSTALLMDRLKPDSPVWRTNWGIYPTARLDLEPHTLPEWGPRLSAITAANAGQELFVRLERQTLTRLPRTRGILFTIRTFVASVEEEAREPERRSRMLATLRSVPVASQRYKRLEPYLPELIAYLEA